MTTAPANLAEAIARLTVDGQAIKTNLLDAESVIEWLKANPPHGEEAKVLAAARQIAFGHEFLDRGGYALEDVCGVPEGTFGAGGSSKGGSSGPGG